MHNAEKFDVSTLNWVKGEIDETLKQARIALEAFVENSDELAQLESCIAALHQVAGTLQMVELHGSARFAAEMEHLAIALEKSEVSDREHSFEVLMRAILQLPDYLESLLSSTGENPIVLLPLMNELRQSRGEKKLNESIFFNPDLSVMPKSRQVVTGIDIQLVARKLRPYFQSALLKFFQGLDVSVQLAIAEKVFEKLSGVATRPQLVQWLWVARGFSEGLREGGILLDAQNKQLFGKNDQLLKQLAEQGESAIKAENMVVLIRTMLYQIAIATTNGRLVRALRDAFHLDSLVPASVQTGQALLGGFNAELKRTVSADILEELARVKETFDIFVRSDHRDISSLTGIADSLGTMAETLVLLRHDNLSDELRKQSTILHSIVRGETAPEDSTLMGVAGTILSVESTLSDWGNTTPVEKADDITGQVSVEEVGQLAEAEHARVIRLVMKEARDGVIKVREAISQYLEHPEDKSALTGIPAQLHEIIGGLTMLSYRRVAQVLRACGMFIGQELINGHALPKPEKLDALADAIMSIEYYLEAFVQSRVHPASVLEVAERGVAELGYPVDDLPELESSEDQTESDSGLVEAASYEMPVDVQPAPTGHEVVAIQQQAAPATYVNPEVDNEILEIFIEESQEEVAKIDALLPKWSNNPDDDEALRDLRRCFHTLKGSGRLVGASILGEFAWAFENMLNRVIDGTLRAGPAMFDMLDQAREALPQLIANFQSGTPLSDDIELLRQSAREIVEPGGMQFKQRPSVTITQPSSHVAVAGTAPPEAQRLELDPVLLEIYAKETEGHLEQLTTFIDSYRKGTHRVNEPLIRALHTLTGSSRMAGVVPVAELSSLLEKYAKTIQVERIPMAEEGVELLEGCISLTREMLAHLHDSDSNPLPCNDVLVSRASALYETVKHAEEKVAARPEAGLAAKPEEVHEIASLMENNVSEEAKLVTVSVYSESSGLPSAQTGAADLEKAFEILDTQPVTPTPLSAEVIELKPVELPKAPAKSRTVVEEYDPELLDIFLEEGVDILNASEETLQAWVRSPGDRSLVEMLQRHLHTLKGGARMAGISAIGDLSHSLETTFEAVVEGRLERSKRMMDLLQLAHDRLVVMLEQVRNRQPLTTGDDLIKEIYQLGKGSSAEQQAETAVSEVTVIEPAYQVKSGIDPLELLLQSGKERIDRINEKTATWSRSPDELHFLHEIRSDAEALMHEAGAAVIVEITELAKAINDLLRAVNDGHVPVSEKMFTLLSSSSERLSLIFGQLIRRASLSNGLYLVANISDLIKASLAEQQSDVERQAEQAMVTAPTLEQPREVVVETVDEENAENRRQGPRVQHEMVRVRADLLDNMVNFAGEVSIYRSRVEQQLGAIRFNIDDLDQTVTRLRDQVRQFDIETEAQIDSRYREAVGQDYEEFDPLEFDRFTNMQQLSRSMMESLNDLLSIEEMMLNLSRESETLLLQQSRVNTELQETLMHTRMVPLVEHAPRLRRIVRQTCAELKKEASLSFKGADVEMDRNVVERIIAPLEHMLRNSIAHGIEAVDKRLARGKAAEGSIVVALSREGSEVVIRVSDDGGGINLEAVRHKAIEKGLMAPEAKLSDKEVMHFILESGFSTAETLSQIAGRGVGMDVVASEIKQLGGVLEIDSEAGKGTRFTIRLPLTLSVSRALLVHAGEDIYAIPLLSITGIERISKGELDQLLANENPQYRWVGQDYDLLYLSRALGVTTTAPVTEGEKMSLLLAQSGENRVALAVDSLVGNREIVVKSLGPQLSTLQDISGATILADGHVALIIDLPALIRRGLARRGGAAVAAVQMPVEAVPTVMVVDDSITVRKVTERLLKRHNMKCVTAKDGVDALAVLEDVTPDVMLLDIEMPRMDGYELATHIRNSARFHKLPIIMITSRTGEKHRQRAMEIGVNVYMGKPYTEADLLDNIEQLLKQPR